MVALRLAVVLGVTVAGCGDFDLGPSRAKSPQPPQIVPMPSCGGSADSDGDCVSNAEDRCSGTPAGRPVWPTGDWAGCAGGQYRDSDKVPPGPKADAGPPPPTPMPPPPSPDSGPAPSPNPNPNPNPSPNPSPSPSPGVQLTATEKDLMDSINKARQQLGLSTLVVDPQLMCAAKLMIASGGCDHYAGGTWSARAQKCGMGSQAAFYVNEIIAQGQQDGAECVDSWHSSPGHWTGLTHPKAKTIGVGVRPSDNCWVAMFDCCIMGSE